MAQEIGIVVMHLVRCPALANEALATATDELAASPPTGSTSRTTALVLRNPLTQVLQLLQTASHAAHRCGCPTSSRSGRSLHRRVLSAVRCFPIL
jgi:hypothetical protein